MGFTPGTLWERLTQKAEHALRVGALLLLPTEQEWIKDHGIHFLVRILTSLNIKDEARKAQDKTSATGHPVNPFLPYEEDLYVADISETHVALLNKFCVVDRHLLIVTRIFEDQEMLLTPGDFEALWTCMGEINGLAFYNAGEAAGASQAHKHLQIVPLPLTSVGPAVPVEPLLGTAGQPGRIESIPSLPFHHAFVRLGQGKENPREMAAGRFTLYGEMLRWLGMTPPTQGETRRQSAPYCLIATQDWMLLVPRSRESFESISINSLGFVGTLLVTHRKEMQRLKEYGPMEALKAVALSI